MPLLDVMHLGKDGYPLHGAYIVCRVPPEDSPTGYPMLVKGVYNGNTLKIETPEGEFMLNSDSLWGNTDQVAEVIDEVYRTQQTWYGRGELHEDDAAMSD